MASDYVNPIGAGLTPERIDMGVDYGGAGPLYALGAGTVTCISNSGWPGGAFICIHLDTGQYIYYAEDITPLVAVGDAVTAGQHIGNATGGPDGIEVGWAEPPGIGNTMAQMYSQQSPTGDPGSVSTAFGYLMSELIASLGGPAGILQGPISGTVPASFGITIGGTTTVTTSTVTGWDATGSNLSHAPSTGQAAGYVTGGSGIEWTAAQWDQYPKAIRIDQSASVAEADYTADIFDYESGAVTTADLPALLKGAQAAYKAGTRPGQRQPGVYCSESNVTTVANALSAAGITNVPLWIADWTGDETSAAAAVAAGSGPYPIVGYQYESSTYYDLDVFSESWLNTVSGSTSSTSSSGSSVKASVPPGPWTGGGTWDWKEVIVTGIGTDGNLYAFAYDTATGAWVRCEPFSGETRV